MTSPTQKHPIRRLVSVGNVIIDIVTVVDAIPERGSDVFAKSGRLEPGGGFNLMVAARRQGLRVGYAGTTGAGPFGELARAALDREDIDILHEPVVRKLDTGFDVAIVDAGGERTFVTVVGAESELTDWRLDQIEIEPTDALAVSGYGLLHPNNRQAVLSRMRVLPDETTVVYDPGPLGHELAEEHKAVVYARADWWSGNRREAALETGLSDPVAAAAALLARLGRGSVIVRLGSEGCVVLERDGLEKPGLEQAGGARTIAGYSIDAVDSNGAGDAHVGVFIAGLSAGLSVDAAITRANAAAAISVTKEGPAASPTRLETDAFLTAHQG